MEWKGFEKKAFDALMTKIVQIWNTSNSNTSAIAGKQDKVKAASCTIPAAGWTSDGTEGYPYYYDISVSGVTANDRPEVTLSVSSIGTAESCGLCPTCESLSGKIRLRAKSAPTAAITAEYWIEQGKE